MLILILIIVILALIYALLVLPVRNDRINAFVGQRYAHRGLHDDKIPENSMAAFERAVELGFGIELDVRLSKDGKLVVFHDDTLQRMVGVHGSTTDYTAYELAAMSLGDSDEGIPQLRDVLRMVDGRVPLLIEIKELSKEKDVAPALAMMLRSYEGPYIVESFNPLSLMRFAKILPHVPRGILSQNYYKYPEFHSALFLALQLLLFNRVCRPCFVAYHKNHAKKSSSFYLARLMGAATFAWTVKSEEEEKEALNAGFDTVIFEGYIPKQN
jgi:glycerophosphoryl diester phosphodiesterase